MPGLDTVRAELAEDTDDEAVKRGRSRKEVNGYDYENVRDGQVKNRDKGKGRKRYDSVTGCERDESPLMR